ncbi:MAG: hypothetical protein ACE5JD_03350 [Candidatus Methylomirabilia bacterium]
MNLQDVKNRVAKALVESIFRRAQYEITPFTPGDIALWVGREDFSPDFRVVRKSENGNHREFLVEVKYQPAVTQYLSVENQRGDRSVLLMARRRWPNLYFVLVSERPEPGRSCFQGVNLQLHDAGPPFVSMGLADDRELKIVHQNVEDCEELLRRIFTSLTEI